MHYARAMRFGDWVKESGRTLESIAEETGLDWGTVYRLARGHTTRPGPRTIAAIIKLTGEAVTLADLVRVGDPEAA